MRASIPAVNQQKNGRKYAIYGFAFAKSVIHDNHATFVMQFLQRFALQTHPRNKDLLMRDHSNEDNGVGHPF